MPQPENKDLMIDYLVKRLQSAEEAIRMSEEIIQHERQNRKEMSKDLKQRNHALRDII
jgi:chromosome segregation ATPase